MVAQKVKIEGTGNILDAMSKKLQATYTVTVHESGKTHIQVHSKSNPRLTYKFQHPNEVDSLVSI